MSEQEHISRERESAAEDENRRVDPMPSGEEIRAAFADKGEELTPREEAKDQKKRDNPLGNLERNTFTMSLVVTILGLICLPSVEKGGSTWYVLMFVFVLNGALLAWILIRIIGRLRDRKKKQ